MAGYRDRACFGKVVEGQTQKTVLSEQSWKYDARDHGGKGGGDEPRAKKKPGTQCGEGQGTATEIFSLTFSTTGSDKV